MKKKPSPAKSSCTSSAREKWRKSARTGVFFLSRRKPLPLRSAHPWRYLSRRQAGTALQGPIDSAPTARGSGLWPLFKSAQTRGLTQFCARRAHFLPPPRGVLSSPPFSFRAKRERAAGAVQERTRQGHESLLPYMKREWAPGPPHSLVRALPERLRGVSGRVLASGRMTGNLAPTIFLWYRQAAPSLFVKKRWWGRPSPTRSVGSPRPAPWRGFISAWKRFL